MKKRQTMLEDLTICELESFIKLCDRKKEIMYRKLSVNGNRSLQEEYERLFEVSEKFDDEFNRRLEMFEGENV